MGLTRIVIIIPDRIIQIEILHGRFRFLSEHLRCNQHYSIGCYPETPGILYRILANNSAIWQVATAIDNGAMYMAISPNINFR